MPRKKDSVMRATREHTCKDGYGTILGKVSGFITAGDDLQRLCTTNEFRDSMKKKDSVRQATRVYTCKDGNGTILE